MTARALTAFVALMVMSSSCMRNCAMRSSTVLPGPGRKLARTRYAVLPKRRSIEAGWI